MEEELNLEPDDLYADGFVLDYDDGTYTLESEDKTYQGQVGDIIHEVIQGDNVSNLAFKYYANSKLWHKIAKANDLEDPISNLEPGTSLIIPDPEIIKNQL